MIKNTRVKMTENALDNYGEEYRDITFLVTGVYHNEKEHQGYDMGVFPQALHDLKNEKTGEDLQFCLYTYELKRV